MTDIEHRGISLGDAATGFLAGLSPEKRGESQQEVGRFVRWFGAERPLAGLAAHDIESYAEQLSCTDTDYARKLGLIRAFLAQAKKAGWTATNMGVHLKTKKKAGPALSKQGLPQAVSLTQEGYAKMKEDLAGLKGQRREAIDEVRKAAADKDFRENAPFHAARERRGHLEGRIKELEETLKVAKVITEDQKVAVRAGIGDSVVLSDVASGEELCYMIVNPKETDPLRGKISSASPIGKAIVGRREGDIVEVTVPSGKVRYKVQRVRH